ncbi:hypothetical protein BaRGS_00013139, partial [Batillaria attramentaria]
MWGGGGRRYSGRYLDTDFPSLLISSLKKGIIHLTASVLSSAGEALPQICLYDKKKTRQAEKYVLMIKTCFLRQQVCFRNLFPPERPAAKGSVTNTMEAAEEHSKEFTPGLPCLQPELRGLHVKPGRCQPIPAVSAGYRQCFGICNKESVGPKVAR